MIEPRTCADRRNDAERYGNQKCDDHRDKRQLERGRETRGQIPADRLAGDQGAAELSRGNIAKIANKLFWHWTIKAKSLPDLRQLLLRSERPGRVIGGRIARQHAD